MNKRRIVTVFGAVVGCAFALVACRAEEQGRIIRYKPGVYLGKKDTELGEAQKEEIKMRTAGQGDSNYGSIGGGATRSGVDTGALGTRTQRQGGSTP